MWVSHWLTGNTRPDGSSASFLSSTATRGRICQSSHLFSYSVLKRFVVTVLLPSWTLFGLHFIQFFQPGSKFSHSTPSKCVWAGRLFIFWFHLKGYRCSRSWPSSLTMVTRRKINSSSLVLETDWPNAFNTLRSSSQLSWYKRFWIGIFNEWTSRGINPKKFPCTTIKESAETKIFKRTPDEICEKECPNKIHFTTHIVISHFWHTTQHNYTQ